MKTNSGYTTNGTFIKFKSGHTRSWCVETENKVCFFRTEHEADEYASQFQQEWIPVEVRLPKSMTNVYTTIKILDEIFVMPNWFSDHWYVHNDHVIAWQLIITPQPYNPTKS